MTLQFDYFYSILTEKAIPVKPSSLVQNPTFKEVYKRVRLIDNLKALNLNQDMDAVVKGLYDPRAGFIIWDGSTEESHANVTAYTRKVARELVEQDWLKTLGVAPSGFKYPGPIIVENGEEEGNVTVWMPEDYKVMERDRRFQSVFGPDYELESY